MSLDISLDQVQLTTVVSKNITRNLGGMWSVAGVYDALYERDKESTNLNER